MAEAAESKPKTWGPATAIIVTIAIYLGAQLIGGLLVSLYPALKQWDEVRTGNWLDNSVWAQFFLVGSVEAVSLWLLNRFLRRFKASFKSLGLRWPQARDVWLAASGYAAYFIILVVFMGIFNALFPQIALDQQQEVGFSGASGPELLLVFGSLVILPAIVEEILVRGFLYTGIRNRLPVIQSALLTSLIFAAAHLQFGSGDPLVWSAAADTFFLSLVLIYLKEKTGSLAAPITLHLIKNTIAFTALFIIVRR